MKKPITWRLLLLVVGSMLGLLAGLGLSAPATAAPAVAAAASYDVHGYGADLDLKINKDGKFKVVGEDFKAKKVDVKVVKLNKHKVIAHKTVWTHHGDFKWTGKKLRCGDTYKAFAHSKKDGWVESNKLYVKCHKGRY